MNDRATEKAAIAELAKMATPEGHARAAIARLGTGDRIELLQKLLSEEIRKRQAEYHSRPVSGQG